MFGLFLTDEPDVRRYEQVMACDAALFGRLFHALLARGVYLAPSAYEAGFVSSAHTREVIDETLAAAAAAFAAIGP